jgi:hypothetical protein
VAAAVGVHGDERLAGVVEGDALDGVLLDGSRNSDKAHGPTGAADAEVASDAAITPIAPASERRVVDWALMRVACLA